MRRTARVHVQWTPREQRGKNQTTRASERERCVRRKGKVTEIRAAPLPERGSCRAGKEAADCCCCCRVRAERGCVSAVVHNPPGPAKLYVPNCRALAHGNIV